MNNFYTLLFLNKRNDPSTIFVFPTIKRLAQRLINKFELEDLVIYSNQVDFLKILSCLGNEPKMLEVLQWLLSFLTNSKGEFSSLNDSATKMNFDLTRTLFNSVFEIKRKDYYKCLAALPTKSTIGKPFYVLMQFGGKKIQGILNMEMMRGFLFSFAQSKKRLFGKISSVHSILI